MEGMDGLCWRNPNPEFFQPPHLLITIIIRINAINGSCRGELNK